MQLIDYRYYNFVCVHNNFVHEFWVMQFSYNIQQYQPPCTHIYQEKCNSWCLWTGEYNDWKYTHVHIQANQTAELINER